MKSHSKLLALGVMFIWVLIWSLGFMNYFTQWLNTHPEFPIPLAWMIHQAGYLATTFGFAIIFLRKAPHITRFSLGTWAIFVAWEIAIPPTCIAPNGALLVTPTNRSCVMGNDTMVSWIMNKVLLIPYNNPVMYYATYVIGTMGFAILGFILLKKKELWYAIGRNLTI